MNFKNVLLEKIFKNFKWIRNNTIQLFSTAHKSNIHSYKSPVNINTPQHLLFQFQCVVTTTDSYYRKIINHQNKNYGILIQNGKVINKVEINAGEIEKLFLIQLEVLENLFKTFDEKKLEKHIDNILTISNHEYLHQGQMIIMFREAGVELPERFKKAWAL